MLVACRAAPEDGDARPGPGAALDGDAETADGRDASGLRSIETDADRGPGVGDGGSMDGDIIRGTEEGTAEDATAPRDLDATIFGLVIPDAVIVAIRSEEAGTQEARCETGPTPSGVGLACTRRGRQCPPDLTCTADWRGETGICTRLGCGVTPDDCGVEASCCTLLQAGGVSLCYPDACRPSTCLEDFQ